MSAFDRPVGWATLFCPPLISANAEQTLKLFARLTSLGVLKQLKLFYSEYTGYLCITMSALRDYASGIVPAMPDAERGNVINEI